MGETIWLAAVNGLLAGLATWYGVRCYRRGAWWDRRSGYVTRWGNPILFWSWVALMAAVASGCLFIASWLLTELVWGQWWREPRGQGVHEILGTPPFGRVYPSSMTYTKGRGTSAA